LSQNLGFTPDCFTGRETHFLTQVPNREKMQALVAASEKVRPLLNPSGEYNLRIDELLKQGLSGSDARKKLEAKEPALVLARDNQTVIERRAQLLGERQASTQDHKRGQPTFLGQIAPGRRVVIVDDVATFGSTLANLRGWIEHQGAHVIRATTLGATFGGTRLAQSIRLRLFVIL
jgi:hypothetical protein